MSTNVTWYDGVTYSVPAGGEINWPALSNLLIALASKAAITTIATQAIRVAVTSPITMASATDYTVVSNLTVPGAVTVNLGAGVAGRIQTIVDGKGDAGTNNITINRAGSDTINGGTTLVLNHNRQSVTLQYDAATTDWKVITSSIPAGTITPADIVGVIPADKGGTGVSNNVAATTTRVGSFALTETLSGVTSVTLPTTGTLATLAGAETLSNKTLTAPILNTPVMGSYEDWTDQGSDPAAPGAGITRIFTKAGIPYKKTSTLPTTQIGGAAAGGKNYLSASTSTAAGWASTGTATATTDTTTADLPEAITVGTGILFTLGSVGNYSFARWTLDPSDYNAGGIILKAAVKALASYASGNAKIEVYSNTAANYSGTSTRLALSTDSSAVSGLTTAQNYLGFYDNPGSSAPYMELRIVTVVATGTLCMSSVSTGPGQAVQGGGIGPYLQTQAITVVGLGTITSPYYDVNRVGNRVVAQGAFVCGTPTAVVVSIALPTGLTLNPLQSNGVDTVVGKWWHQTATGSVYKTGALIAPGGGSTVVYFSQDYYVTSGTGPGNRMNGTQIGASSGESFYFEFSGPINEWAGSGVVNLAQNGVTYFSNDGTEGVATNTDYVNTTHLVYGPNGSLFPAITTFDVTAPRRTRYLVRSPYPIQLTDQIAVEVNNGNGWEASGFQLNIGSLSQNNGLYGIWIEPVSGSSTDLYICFGNGGGGAAGSTYGSNGLSWSTTFGTWRYRIKKSVAGVATGFGSASIISSGLIDTNPQSFAGLKTFTAGAAITAVGLTLPTTGGTPVALDYYETKSYASTIFRGVSTGSGNQASVTIRVTRVGDLVTISFPAITITTATTDGDIGTDSTGASNAFLDARFRPSTTRFFFVPGISGGVSQTAPAVLRVNSGGDLVIYKDATFGISTFAAGTSGIPQSGDITYKI